MKVSIDILSGAGRKTAAAILVTYQASNMSRELRFLLDAGGALEVGEDKGWAQPENLDAILISHDHQDHMGGLIDVDGNVPVYATQEVQKWLPTHLNLQTLPVGGMTLIEGIEVTTGSAGHSFGGVWVHLNIGEGIYYSGDFSLESTLYPFTMPPKARIALLDASYGLYDNSLEQGKQSLLTFLKEEKSLVMPVPQSGRALEIACWLTTLDFHDWTLGEDCLSPENALMAPIEGICVEARTILKRLQGRQFDPTAKVILCGDPDGISGIAAELLLRPETYLPVYTGHLPEHARQAVSEDRAHFVRWNVHPRIRDLKTLVDHLECDRCFPLFHGMKDLQEWQAVLGPSVTSKTSFEQTYTDEQTYEINQ